MSTDRAEAAIETAIAEYVVQTYRQSGHGGKPDTLASQVRSRITGTFQAGELSTGQDNHPPALLAFYRRVAAAFAPVAAMPDRPELASRLIGMKGSLETLRSALPSTTPNSRLDQARVELRIERQQLLVKNALTEGFGRMEAWILSIGFLILVLLDAISLLWGLPFLGLVIGRAWYLERQCRRRRIKVADIDALIGRIDRMA